MYMCVRGVILYMYVRGEVLYMYIRGVIFYSLGNFVLEVEYERSCICVLGLECDQLYICARGRV